MNRAAQWRRLPVGLSLILIAAFAYLGPLIHSGEWVTLVPTRLLVMTFEVEARWHPSELDRELERRVQTYAISYPNACRLAERVVSNLGADDVKWNANDTLRMLQYLGPAAHPVLERAMLSPDWQKRQYAALALIGRHEHRPSDRMLRVLVESLKDDRLDLRANATRAFHRLTNEDPNRLLPFVREGIRGRDVQQRLLSATLAGYLDMDALLPDAAPVLLDHVRDNRRFEDARIAAPALYRFGKEVIPWLEPYRESDDPQQRYVVECILHELGVAPKPSNPERIQITSLVENPLTDFPPYYVGL